MKSGGSRHEKAHPLSAPADVPHHPAVLAAAHGPGRHAGGLVSALRHRAAEGASHLPAVSAESPAGGQPGEQRSGGQSTALLRSGVPGGLESVPAGRELRHAVPPLLGPIQPPVPVGQPVSLWRVLLCGGPGNQVHRGRERQLRATPQPGPGAVAAGRGGSLGSGRGAGHHGWFFRAGGPGLSGTQPDGRLLPPRRRAGAGSKPGLLLRGFGPAALGFGGFSQFGARGVSHPEGGCAAPAGKPDSGVCHTGSGLLPPGNRYGGLRRPVYRGGELPLAAARYGAFSITAVAVYLPLLPPEDFPAHPGTDGRSGADPPGGAGLPD